MPTMREASTPSRRAMRKAESTETPVENDLQQRIQSSASLSLSSSAHALSFDTVEWWLASIYSDEKNAPYRRDCRAALLGACVSRPSGPRPSIAKCEARCSTLACEARSQASEETC